jgi:hypothetical protein
MSLKIIKIQVIHYFPNFTPQTFHFLNSLGRYILTYSLLQAGLQLLRLLFFYQSEAKRRGSGGYACRNKIA